MVAITGAVPVFTAVNAAMFPVPLAAKPIEVVLFVQLYTIVPPVVRLAKVTADTVVALQTTLLATAVTVALGLTVILPVAVVVAAIPQPPV